MSTRKKETTFQLSSQYLLSLTYQDFQKFKLEEKIKEDKDQAPPRGPTPSTTKPLLSHISGSELYSLPHYCDLFDESSCEAAEENLFQPQSFIPCDLWEEFPETHMGHTEQESLFEWKGKKHLTSLELIQHALSHWIHYREHYIFDDMYDTFHHNSDYVHKCEEYKWNGVKECINSNIAQKVKGFIQWMNMKDDIHILHDKRRLHRVQKNGH